MALNDCLKCWDTPCSCGWDYRNYTIDSLEEMQHIFARAIEFKRRTPSANFSGICEEETSDDKKYMDFISSS